MKNKHQLVLIVAIIILAAASRLVNHPFNFTPIIAMSIFAGAYLGKKWGIALPLAAMIVSDYIIGFYDWQVMASVYIGIALAFFIGRFLQSGFSWAKTIGAAIASSIAFFLITNFAVWAFFNWYPHTWAGLANCFTLALPFFRNSLAGDVIYTILFIGSYEFILFLKAKKVVKLQNTKTKLFRCF